MASKHLAITMCAYKEAKIITWKISPKPNESRLVAICLTLAYQIVVFETNKKTIQYLCVTKSRYVVFDVHHEMDAEFNMHTHFQLYGTTTSPQSKIVHHFISNTSTHKFFLKSISYVDIRNTTNQQF